MKKLIVIIALFLCLNTTYSYAEENNLKLEDALKNVEKSSPMTLMDYSLLRLDYTYTIFKDMIDKIPIGMQAGLDSQTLANMGLPFTKKDKLAQDRLVYIQPKTLLATASNLKKNKETTKNALKLGVEELYNGILISSEAVKLQEEATSVSETQYKNGQQKFTQGLISKNDLEKLKIDYENNTLKLNTQKRSKQNMIFTLNKMMGVKIGTEYSSIEGRIEKIESFDFDMDLESVKEKALESRTEIAALKEEIENLEEEMFFTKSHYLPEETQYLIMGTKIEIAEEKLNNLKQDIEFEIEDAFETINKNYIEIEKAQIELENANSKYKDMQEKYNMGLITKDILDLTHIGVSAANLKLSSAISTYNMSVKKFNLAIGIGPKFN